MSSPSPSISGSVGLALHPAALPLLPRVPWARAHGTINPLVPLLWACYAPHRPPLVSCSYLIPKASDSASDAQSVLGTAGRTGRGPPAIREAGGGACGSTQCSAASASGYGDPAHRSGCGLGGRPSRWPAVSPRPRDFVSSDAQCPWPRCSCRQDAARDSQEKKASPRVTAFDLLGQRGSEGDCERSRSF